MGIRRCALGLPGNNDVYIHLSAANGGFMCSGQCTVGQLPGVGSRKAPVSLSESPYQCPSGVSLPSGWGGSGNHPMARRREKRFLAQKVMPSSTVCT